MKKIIIVLAGIMAATLLAGCGEEGKVELVDSGYTPIKINEIQVEEIEVEEIQIEEILTEETMIEKTYIDSEYESELEYNSKVNTWENSTTYWD